MHLLLLTQLNASTDDVVLSYTQLKGLPMSDQARFMLKKIASLVKHYEQACSLVWRPVSWFVFSQDGM